MSTTDFDVVIIGGGPAGSTCGGLLAKYNPNLKVGIFEREVFPRDHVGESQLPLISRILDELGAWEKIESAGFPVKIGATYRWGKSDDLWDFNFIAHGAFEDEARPAKFEGQRLQTAFQVDRAVYDKILLDHAKELGCEVHEATGVRKVVQEDDLIDHLVLDNGEIVRAKTYVDASGHAGVLRRAMGVDVSEPSTLKNIAIWDYWQSAEWAVSLGVGGTRVQVMSLGYGWIWFIPISETRTSVGFICPADYYKKTGLKPTELYMKALAEEPRIASLLQNATREEKLATTKDWSFLADRLAGKNWFLTGESAGFADPILAAGMTLSHVSAQEAACSILELGKGRDEWLKTQYDERNRRRILQHIRFADYWYTANGHFGELKEFTREIAKDAGLDLDANAAFRWLGTGGFVEEDMGLGGIAGFSLDCVHFISNRLSDEPPVSPIDGYSGFSLRLKDAERIEFAYYEKGRVIPVPAYRRDGKILPLIGFFGWIVAGLQYSPSVEHAFQFIRAKLAEIGEPYDGYTHSRLVQTLEAMARDGWVACKKFQDGPLLSAVYGDGVGGGLIDENRDMELPAERRAKHLVG
jgi:flavin-dependent dehydrogenase